MQSGGCVYIVTNAHHNVLYVGVSSELYQRIYKHKEHFYKSSFSDKYNVAKLVYYEGFAGIEEAIARETQIKKWSRAKKVELINSLNPEWKDLWEDIVP